MLIDRFGRKQDYLRISVTDRCDMRCTYCVPSGRSPALPRTDSLTVSEIEYLTQIFVGLGIRKVRITGGEPLIRPDIETILVRIGRIPGIEQFALSTNGTHLIEKLEDVYKSGIRHLNISLDSLREDRFRALTRSKAHGQVLSAIKAAVAFRSHGQSFDSVKINSVIIRSFNDDELCELVDFGEQLCEIAGEHGPSIEIRFIEFMPFHANGWDTSRVVTYEEMQTIIRGRHDLIDLESTRTVHSPATQFTVDDHGRMMKVRIGFIASMSKPFCQECNRLRLTSQGVLRSCLFGGAEVDLKRMLNRSETQESIEKAIRNTVEAKWEAHPTPIELQLHNTLSMVSIGG